MPPASVLTIEVESLEYFVFRSGLVYLYALGTGWKTLYIDTCTANDFINKTFLKKLPYLHSADLIRINDHTYHFESKLGGVDSVFFVPVNKKEEN